MCARGASAAQKSAKLPLDSATLSAHSMPKDDTMDNLLDRYSQEEIENAVVDYCQKCNIPFDCGQSLYSFEPSDRYNTWTITMESYVEEES